MKPVVHSIISIFCLLYAFLAYAQDSGENTVPREIPITQHDTENPIQTEIPDSEQTGSEQTESDTIPSESNSEQIHFIQSCQWIQSDPSPYLADWPHHCEIIQKFCTQAEDENHLWIQTPYGQSICQTLINKCPQKDETSRTWRLAVEEFSAQVCNAWEHCIPDTDQSTDLPAEIQRIAADSLALLGFKVKNTSPGIQIKSGHTPIPSQYLEDRVLKTIMSLYSVFLRERSLTSESILNEEFENLFSDQENDLENSSLLTVYNTLLPDMMHHAVASGSPIASHKLRESQISLNTYGTGNICRIHCTQTTSGQNISIRFSANAVISEHYQDVEIQRTLQCPQNPEELHFDRGNWEDESILCHCEPVFQTPPAPNDYFQNALNETLQNLIDKDNDGIAQAMGDLSDALNLIYNRYGYIAVWNDHWEHAPVNSWLCQIQTIELLALEQQRMIEIARLERSLQKVFGKTTFYQRLSDFDTCRHKLSGKFAETASNLYADHHEDYRWIIRNFAPKNEKKLGTAFSKWTHRISKAIRLERTLLAAATAWSNQKYSAAVHYAFEVTDSRQMIIHPQLNSFHQLLTIIRDGSLPQNTTENYTRVMLLKSPALVYQMFSEASHFLNKSERSFVVDTVRQYPATLFPMEAARFFETYESDFRQGLSAQKRSDFNAWMEHTRNKFLPPKQRMKRRIKWIQDLVSLKNWLEIEQASSYILIHDTELTPTERSHFAEISTLAQFIRLKSQEPSVKYPDTSWILPRDEKFDECLQKQSPERSTTVHAIAHIQSILKCW